VSLKQKTKEKKTRQGAECGRGRLERMKHGNGINGRDDKSIGIEILMSEVSPKSNPLTP
jgi:hypothetical protein